MPSILERFRNAGKALLGRSSGSFAPIELWGTGNGIGHQFKPDESLNAYGDNTWLYASVNRISFEVAQTKFKLRKVNSNGEIEYIQSHQALETLKRPHPIKGGKSLLTGMDLKLITHQHTLLNGEGFWLLLDRLPKTLGGSPQRIMPLLPGYMRVDVNSTGDIVKYIYRLPTKEIHLDPLDVVHFKIPDPRNHYRGHSPTQSIRFAIDTYKEAEKMNLKKLQNNAVPGGFLKPENKLQEDDIKRLREQWNQLYGGSENSGKVAVLPNKMDFEEAQMTNADMQYIEGKNMSRDEILANYGVGLEILGRTESQTRANAEAAIFVFQKFGVLPWLMKFCDTLNNDFLPAFTGTEDLEFVFDDPVPENMEEKRLNSEVLFRNGALTPDEMREMFGMEPIGQKGVTDVPYMDFNKVPSGAAPPDENLE